ncbi:MAG: DUF1294 domain-containing protein [Clostridia bacterium]|nr:DUF1294 domain-containing protein [Clostridia bacterium]
MEKIFIIYLIIINIVTFFVFGIDKKKAKKSKWRISEKALFVLSAIGGSLGALSGMYTFRHKTKKKTFKIGIPAILIVQIVLIFFINK